MANKRSSLFFPVVDAYFDNKSSIRTIARKFNIHYQTVFKWIKEYKKSNYKGFLLYRNYKRLPLKEEKFIINLKERYPTLRLNQAKRLLARKNVNITSRGIWSIWRRNGYCGFSQSNLSNDFTDFIPLTKEVVIKLKQAEYLFNKNRVKESAQILNSITWLPKNDLVLKLPDEVLNPRRRLEKLIMQFGSIPILAYIKKVKSIYQIFIRNNCNYSALRAGIVLISALQWHGSFQDRKFWTEKVLALLPPRIKYPNDLLPLYYSLLLSKCGYLTQELKIKHATRIIRHCYRLIANRKHFSSYFLYNLAVQYINLEDFNTAQKLLNKAAIDVDANTKKMINTLIAIYVYLLRCDKDNAQRLLNEAEILDWAKNAQLSRFQSYFSLIEGNPQNALHLAKEALDLSTEAGLVLDIFNSYLAMASAYSCLGEKNKAKELLQKLKTFLKRKKSHRQLLTVNILLHKIPQNKEVLKLPSFKLAWILQNQGFSPAYQFALKKGLMFYFYRYLFFYPEIVQKRISKNKPTALPRTILRLPIFNTATNVYHINLLGKITIFLNQKYLKSHLSPKDTALFLYIANKLPEPEKSLPLIELYNNFWPKSQNPARIFSHNLVRIKKALKIPGHYLEIKRQDRESLLINHNLYFTTDYQEFEQTLARAKALQRAGEWGFAKKEYLRAFKLFRGEPFKKNFDNWSVDTRFRILTQFETEAINFAKSCLEHGNKKDAKKVLEKILKIIPDSEEIKDIVKRLDSKNDG